MRWLTHLLTTWRETREMRSACQRTLEWAVSTRLLSHDEKLMIIRARHYGLFEPDWWWL